MRREGDEANIKQSIIYNNLNNFIFNNLRSRSAIEAHRLMLGIIKALNASALPQNQRFSGAPNARIVRQSRSFDRREIRTPLGAQGNSY